MGIMSTIIAFFMENIVDGMLYFARFHGSIVCVPIFAALYGIKTHKATFYISGFLSLSVFIILYSVFKMGYISHVSSFLTGVITFTFISLMFHKKKVIAYMRNFKIDLYDIKIILRYKVKHIISSIRRGFQSQISSFDAKVIEYSEYNIKYGYFIVFVCVTFTVPYIIWDFKQSVGEIIFRFCVTAMSLSLFAKDYLPKQLAKYLLFYWYAIILLYLPTNAVIMFCTQCSTSGWAVNMALSFFMLATLVQWRAFLFLVIVGILCGFLFAKLLLGKIHILNASPEDIAISLYILLFSIALNFIFSRNKEKIWQQKLDTMYVFASAIAHEVRSPLSTMIMNYEFIFSKVRDLIDRKKVEKDAIILLKQIMTRTEGSLIHSLQTVDLLLNASQNKVADEAVKEEFYIKKLCEEAYEEYNFDKSLLDKISLSIKIDYSCFGVREYVKYVIFNILKNAEKHGLTREGARLSIYTTNNRELIFEDTGYGIAKEDLAVIFERFYSKNRKGTGLGLAFCKMVMDNLGGNIKCESEISQYTRFILTFPRKVV